MATEQDVSEGFFDNLGPQLLSLGIVAMKSKDPEAFRKFQGGLATITVGANALVEVLDEENPNSEDILKILQIAKDHGASRILDGILWAVLRINYPPEVSQ